MCVRAFFFFSGGNTIAIPISIFTNVQENHQHTHTQTQKRTMHQNRLTSWFGNFGVNEPLVLNMLGPNKLDFEDIHQANTVIYPQLYAETPTKTRNTTSQEIDIKRRRRWKKGSFQFIALLYRFLAVVYFRLGDLMCQLYPETDNNLCEKK